MNLTYVENLPPRIYKPRNKLIKLIEEFVDSDREVARVDLEKNEYKKPLYAYKYLHSAIKKTHHAVKVTMRGDNIFLVRM